MQLLIKNPSPVEETPKDSYVVEVRSMQGDADGYRDFTVGPFKTNQDEEPLQSLLETLKRMKEAFPNGMGGRNKSYRNVLGFLQWFGTEIVDIEHLQEYYPELLAEHGADVHQKIAALTENHYSEWHGDALTDYTRDEKLTKYAVFYYDENGTKHDVEVVL